jgi:hypothetical protein
VILAPAASVDLAEEHDAFAADVLPEARHGLADRIGAFHADDAVITGVRECREREDRDDHGDQGRGENRNAAEHGQLLRMARTDACASVRRMMNPALGLKYRGASESILGRYRRPPAG